MPTVWRNELLYRWVSKRASDELQLLSRRRLGFAHVDGPE